MKKKRLIRFSSRSSSTLASRRADKERFRSEPVVQCRMHDLTKPLFVAVSSTVCAPTERHSSRVAELIPHRIRSLFHGVNFENSVRKSHCSLGLSSVAIRGKGYCDPVLEAAQTGIDVANGITWKSFYERGTDSARGRDYHLRSVWTRCRENAVLLSHHKRIWSQTISYSTGSRYYNSRAFLMQLKSRGDPALGASKILRKHSIFIIFFVIFVFIQKKNV